MGRSSHTHREEKPEESSESSPNEICVCESRPGRLVFIEDGNKDAWIATDTAVDLIE